MERMPRVSRWLAIMAALLALACVPYVAVTSEPGECGEGEATHVYAWEVDDHLAIDPSDCSNQLCDWDGATLTKRARRRNARSTSYYEIGRAWAEQGEPDLAWAAFERDLEGATSPWARIQDRIGLAELASEAGDLEKALRQLDAGEEELEGAHLNRRPLDEARVDALVAAGHRRAAISVLEPRCGRGRHQRDTGWIWPACAHGLRR